MKNSKPALDLRTLLDYGKVVAVRKVPKEPLTIGSLLRKSAKRSE